MNYFYVGNPVDSVHERWTTAGSHGPPWTGSGDVKGPRQHLKVRSLAVRGSWKWHEEVAARGGMG
jgi:hypothetical protein